jgi:prevent-host-death family protein
MAAHPKSLNSPPALTKRPLAGTPARPTRKTAAKRLSLGEPIAAAKAKAHFLQLLDQVERERRPITITKRGRIVAQLMPAPVQQTLSAFDQVFGSMKGTGRVLGDIVSPDHESWGPKWR